MNKEKEPLIQKGIMEAAFNFWFRDSGHIRSPFPGYIRERLKENAAVKFTDWMSKMSERAKKEINDEIITEKFEEILFETASGLVSTADEKLTILYPFMPRIGDITSPNDASKGESKIISRTHLRRGDHSFLNVKLKAIGTGKEWETEFELPE